MIGCNSRKGCRLYWLLALVSLLFASSESIARVLIVPTNYPSISEAVISSDDGDTVLVLDGTYFDQVRVERPLTIASSFLFDQDTAHIAATIITIPDSIRSNINRSRSPFEIRNVIGFALIGVTVQNGLGSYSVETGVAGGGIFAVTSKITVRWCRIIDCIATRGGGICAYQSKLLLEDSQIQHCNYNVSGTGGGVYANGDSIMVRRNMFERNTLSYGDGGGIYAFANLYGEFSENIVSHNTAPAGSGGGRLAGFSIIINNLIERNSSSMCGGLNISVGNQQDTCTFSGNVVRGNRAVTYPNRTIIGIGGVHIDINNGVVCKIIDNRFEGNYAQNQSVLAFGGALVLQGGTANIQRNYFNGNSGVNGSAIGTIGSDVNLNLDSNSFCDNAGNITIRNLYLGFLRLTACDFINNQGLAVDASMTHAIDATNCYWGHPSGPHCLSNPNGTGATIGENVIYRPYLFFPVFPDNMSSIPYQATDDTPNNFSLLAAYPNPTNGAVTITFSLPEENQFTRIAVYDALGRKVANLWEGKSIAGEQRIQWHPHAIASGNYFVRSETRSGVGTSMRIQYLK